MEGRSRTTYDAGVSSSSGDDVYPRVTYRDDPWIVVMLINPRGLVHGSSDNDHLQPNSTSNVNPVEDLTNVELVVNLTEFGDDAVVHSESEVEAGEFDEDSDSSETTYSE
ncbi:hypothetical protein DY000_02053563 [Brassica cretica]|uniref:Uncharacterized protein n=1 Tax=Brassica cretica TaxID=69181 RepID=A0ABQ7ACY5_BRACR|nr:hypothetical protein DY000_02053563 [Brassica cretica]